MNKKLISAVLSVAMLIGGIGVFAENTSVPRDTITGIATDKENAVFAWNNDSALILNGYDKETGKLAASEVFYAKDGTVTVPVSTLEKYNFRAYSIENDQVYDVAVKTEATEPTETPVPTATATPEETPEPTKGPTPTPAPYNPNEFPAVYEKAVNAVYAFSVIDEVADEAYGSEQGYRVDYYFQGTKHSDWLDNDIEIVSAPDNDSSLVGGKLTQLKRGDVVYFNRSMNGEIKKIGVIYRTQSKDIINNTEDFGTNFEKLFSVQGKAVAGYSPWGVLQYGQKSTHNGTQYAFGLVAKRENTMLYLLNKEGDPKNSLMLQMANNAIVYECDMSLKSGIELGTPLSISSSISKMQWNNAVGETNGKITFDESGYNYALARIVDGTVLELILYTNY